MDQTSLKLPIRLVPRKGSQIFMIVFFGFFLGFAVFWTVMAATMIGKADWSDARMPELLLSRLFPFFGVPFILIGAGGIARAVLKMLPGSPYYHVEIGAGGLLVRSLFKRRIYAWQELPGFETLERRRRTRNGTRIEHFTVAMETLPPPANAPAGSTHQREVMRIFADEYGAKNGKQDADALTDWLNQLRALAAQGRLDADSPVAVPEGFRASVRSAAAFNARAIGVAPVGRSAPVIEQADKRDERSPTVQRR